MDLTKYQSSQDKEELGELFQLLGDQQFKVIVEIGVHQGHSLEVWYDAFKPTLLIGVETEEKPIINPIIRKPEVRLVIGNSNNTDINLEVMQLLNGQSIDLLYIDGDHHYDAVMKDLELYGPLVADDGRIVLHDAGLIGHPDVEVYRVWAELDGTPSKRKLIHSKGTGFGVLWMYNE